MNGFWALTPEGRPAKAVGLTTPPHMFPLGIGLREVVDQVDVGQRIDRLLLVHDDEFAGTSLSTAKTHEHAVALSTTDTQDILRLYTAFCLLDTPVTEGMYELPLGAYCSVALEGAGELTAFDGYLMQDRSFAVYLDALGLDLAGVAETDPSLAWWAAAIELLRDPPADVDWGQLAHEIQWSAVNVSARLNEDPYHRDHAREWACLAQHEFAGQMLREMFGLVGEIIPLAPPLQTMTFGAETVTA